MYINIHIYGFRSLILKTFPILRVNVEPINLAIAIILKIYASVPLGNVHK